MKNFLISCLLSIASSQAIAQQTIIVSPTPGTGATLPKAQTVSTLDSAFQIARQSTEKDIRIYLREGNYPLNRPLEINASQWKNKSLLLAAYHQEKVLLSGGPVLHLKWEKYKKGIWKTQTPLKTFDQLYIDHTPRILARYPNYKDKQILNGTAADALSPERVKRWKSPAGGYIHALHGSEWGAMYYAIKGKQGDQLIYEGGFQNNRPTGMHKICRFVENIFEELDAPGEWFLDKSNGMLYYYPYPGEDLSKTTVEVATLPELIRITGTETTPIQNITIQGIDFVHTTRTFMESYEPLLRSDWRIHRGAAVFVEFAENCTITDCNFYHLGGNAIFFSKYAQNCAATGNHIHDIGASAICFVGDTSAVRSSLFSYGKSLPFDQIDQTPGPKNNLFPRQCIAEDNLIHDIGRVEKQVAGVQIQVASEITVRHNSIYSVPRAAFNIGDGAFGGHLLEYNDAFNTVLETGDHGTFNSWGRDRFWHPSYNEMCKRVAEHPDMILLDACYTTIIRNNRLRCDHGWDIDLDDGSSNYHIYNNLCLNGGIKLREGFYRTVENNIVINNSLHPHVWFNHSGDVIQRNLFLTDYRPIGVKSWGEKVDYNFFPTETILQKAQKRGTDQHSICGEPIFRNASAGDFTVLPECQVFRIGFINFPQDRYGVYSPRLKKLALQPVIPPLSYKQSETDNREYSWLKSRIRAVNGPGDRSAFGLPDEKGIILLEVSKESPLSSGGIRSNDVVLKLNNHTIKSVDELMNLTQKYQGLSNIEIQYSRDQQIHNTTIKL